MRGSRERRARARCYRALRRTSYLRLRLAATSRNGGREHGAAETIRDARGQTQLRGPLLVGPDHDFGRHAALVELAGSRLAPLLEYRARHLDVELQAPGAGADAEGLHAGGAVR